MEYNVFYHNVNGDKIQTYDILREGGVIHNFIREARMKDMNRDEFEAELKRECMYYYWSKCEWETTIGAWVGGAAIIKVDVYQQLQWNWKVFSDICWNLYLGRSLG